MINRKCAQHNRMATPPLYRIAHVMAANFKHSNNAHCAQHSCFTPIWCITSKWQKQRPYCHRKQTSARVLKSVGEHMGNAENRNNDDIAS